MRLKKNRYVWVRHYSIEIANLDLKDIIAYKSTLPGSRDLCWKYISEGRCNSSMEKIQSWKIQIWIYAQERSSISSWMLNFWFLDNPYFHYYLGMLYCDSMVFSDNLALVPYYIIYQAKVCRWDISIYLITLFKILMSVDHSASKKKFNQPKKLTMIQLWSENFKRKHAKSFIVY